MNPHAKTGREACASNWGAQQFTRRGTAAFVEIICHAISCGETKEAARVAINGEARHVQHFALCRRARERVTKENFEIVSGTHLALEVYVVREDMGKFGDDVVRNLFVYLTGFRDPREGY